MVKAWRLPSRLPLAWFTLAEATAVRTSSRVSPLAARRAGLTCTRIAGFCPPLRLTRPTPGSWEIFGTSRVSARTCTAVRGRDAEVRPRFRNGASAGLTLLQIGGGGRGPRAEGGGPVAGARPAPAPALRAGAAAKRQGLAGPGR